MLDRYFKEAKSNNFLYEVGRGSIPGHTPFLVTGNNPSATTNLETLWDEGGIYVPPETPLRLKVSSVNINDTLLGTGARTLFIAGLDTNGYWQTEFINLNGQTEVLTEKTYTRINYAYIATAGSAGRNLGKVYMGDGTVTAGVPATIYASIDGTTSTRDNQIKQAIICVPKGYRAVVTGFLIGAGQGKEVSLSLYSQVPGGLMRGGNNTTMMAAFTIPAGYTGLLLDTHVHAGAKTIDFTLKTRAYGSPEIVKRRAKGVVLNDAHLDYPVPQRLTAGTDIEIQGAAASPPAGDTSADFSLVLIKDNNDIPDLIDSPTIGVA